MSTAWDRQSALDSAADVKGQAPTLVPQVEVAFRPEQAQQLGVTSAVAILGALVTPTILNLFLLPAIYLRFGVKG